MIKTLKKIQADTYLLLIKTQNFHWNVRGPLFQSLHLLFEAQYNELFLSVDEVAERIRALNEKALGSVEEFQKYSNIKSSQETHWKGMINELSKDREKIIKTAKELVKKAEKYGDDGTADLAIKLIQQHQKQVWMLESHLESKA